MRPEHKAKRLGKALDLIVITCEQGDELSVPQLDHKQVAEFRNQLTKAKAALRRLDKRIKGARHDGSSGKSQSLEAQAPSS